MSNPSGPSSYPLVKPVVRQDQAGTGRVRTELSVGELVMVPFRHGHNGIYGYTTQNAHSALNADGSNSVLNYSVVAGAFANLYIIRTLFRGRVLGIRFDPWETANSDPDYFKGLSVLVDDVAYRCPKPVFQPLYQSNFPTASGDYASIIATDLTDGAHILRLTILPGLTKANLTYLYGLLLERRVGYTDPVPYAAMGVPTEVPSANYVEIFIGPFSTEKRVPRGLSKLIYYNSSGSTRTVSIRYMDVVIRVLSLAAGEYQEISHPTPISLQAYPSTISSAANMLMHQASGAGVIWTAVGV